MSVNIYLLHASASIQLRGELDHVILHLCREKLLLKHRAMLKQLLYNVVAKNIDHQGVRIDHNLVKDPLPVITVCIRNLLLEEPRALLVSGEFDDLAKNVLQYVSIPI